jgi:hypothetical protein
MLLHHLGRSWAVDPFNENNPAAFEKFRLRPPDVIEKLVDRSYAHAAVFKPVLTTPHSCQYLNKFPNARMIFIYRHYNDVVNSSIKRFGPADRLTHVNSWIADDFGEFAPVAPPEETKAIVRKLWKPDLSPELAAALYWLFYNTLYFDLGLIRDDRVRLVGYESLVANPGPHLEAACDFLGLKFEPKMTAGIFATSVSRHEVPAIDQEIETACEILWQRLQAAQSKFNSA